PRAGPDEYREPRAGQLGAPRQVEDTECRADVPVRRPAGRRRLAPGTHDPVMAGVAVRQLGERQIRDEQRLALEPGLEIPQFDVEDRKSTRLNSSRLGS